MRRWTIVSAAAALTIGLTAFAGASRAAQGAVPQNLSLPTIVGTAVEGGMLSAGHGVWRSNSKLSFAYQWRRCLADGTGCADVVGATDSIYAPRTDDVGRSVRASVTATNKQGSGVAISAPTVAVTALPAPAPHNSAPPTVSGVLATGHVLVASVGSWTGTAPLAYAYRWRRCSPTGGDCAETGERRRVYKLSRDDIGRTLRVLVTARNAVGTASSLSVPSRQVAKAPGATPPGNSSLPTISGTAQQGKQLTGGRGSWTNSPTSFRYAWLRCDRTGNNCSAIGGARSTAHSPGSADVGHTIRFEVDASNSAGTTKAFSQPTPSVAAAPVTKAPPVNTSLPTVSGTAQDDQTLSGDRGTWTNSPTKYEYTWRRCNQDGQGCDGISGAHATTYKLTSKDVGQTIRFRVTASNADGSNRADSKPSPVVRASGKPDNSSPPTISGTPTEGKTLAGNRGSWTRNPTSYDFAWLRCDRNGNNCAAIGAARATTYTLTSADVGNTIRFRVTASNSEGANTSTSVPTAQIQKASAPPPPRPNGCPPGTGNPDQVAGITPPARLLIDTLQPSPRVVTRLTLALVVRFHVTSTCGGPVQGALVYATATPFGQFAIPPESTTGSDGWATLTFHRLNGFPVSNHQQLIAMFVRARKPGENVLLGISTRRFVSIPVRLH